LHIEATLNELLGKKLKMVREIERLQFHKKVVLAVSLRILPNVSQGGLFYLNHLRNQFGHQLDYQISETDVINFWSALSEEMKESMRNEYEKAPSIRQKLAACIVAIHLDIHTFIGLIEEGTPIDHLLK